MASKNSLASAIASIRAEIASRQAEIRELEAQREGIATACPSRADLFAAVDSRMEADAAKYRRALAKAFDAIAGTPLEIDTRLSASTERYGIDLMALATVPNGRGPAPECVSAPGIALLLNGTLREAMHREAEHFLADKKQGLPLAERRVEIARLDNLIELKRGELAGLLSEASAAGVVISP